MNVQHLNTPFDEDKMKLFFFGWEMFSLFFWEKENVYVYWIKRVYTGHLSPKKRLVIYMYLSTKLLRNQDSLMNMQLQHTPWWLFNDTLTMIINLIIIAFYLRLHSWLNWPISVDYSGTLDLLLHYSPHSSFSYMQLKANPTLLFSMK
jgi:hypothetical protein